MSLEFGKHPVATRVSRHGPLLEKANQPVEASPVKPTASKPPHTNPGYTLLASTRSGSRDATTFLSKKVLAAILRQKCIGYEGTGRATSRLWRHQLLGVKR